MGVGCRDHELALLAWECAHGCDAGVNERLEKLAGDGLGRALFAREREERVGARGPQRSQ